jgi:hypothetical protein
LSAKLAKGVLTTTYKHTRTHSYTLKNSGAADKTILVEHPIEHPWKLVAPEKPAETTRDRYRFAVETKPGEPAKLKIEEEQTARQEAMVLNLDDNAIGVFLAADEISDAVKEALREVQRRRAAMAELAGEKARLAQEIATISDEQARIRENMKSIDRTTDLYKRYVDKFAAQEDQIEGSRTELRKVEADFKQAEKDLVDYVAALELS